MLSLLLCFLLRVPQTAAPSVLPAVSAPALVATQEALTSALVGHWVGVLEYRDYSEPANSTKRVSVPAWLTIRKAPEGVFLETTYDDGPSKVLFEHEALVLDLAQGRYKVIGTDAVLQDWQISGAESLQNGRGQLILTGAGTDNNKPAEVRTIWTVRRNLLSWMEEVRPAGSTEPFVFRHRETYTRAETPAATGVAPR